MTETQKFSGSYTLVPKETGRGFANACLCGQGQHQKEFVTYAVKMSLSRILRLFFEPLIYEWMML